MALRVPRAFELPQQDVTVPPQPHDYEEEAFTYSGQPPPTDYMIRRQFSRGGVGKPPVAPAPGLGDIADTAGIVGGGTGGPSGPVGGGTGGGGGQGPSGTSDALSAAQTATGAAKTATSLLTQAASAAPGAGRPGLSDVANAAGPNFSTPSGGTTVPTPNFSTPTGDAYAQPPNVSTPAPNLSTPLGDISVPAPNVSTPTGDIYAPPPAPESNFSTQIGDIYVPPSGGAPASTPGAASQPGFDFGGAVNTIRGAVGNLSTGLGAAGGLFNLAQAFAGSGTPEQRAAAGISGALSLARPAAQLYDLANAALSSPESAMLNAPAGGAATDIGYAGPTSATGMLDKATPYAAYVRAAFDIIQEAMAGNKSVPQQALDGAFSVLGAAFAPASFGLSTIAAKAAQTDLDRTLRAWNEGDMKTFGAELIPGVAPIADIMGMFGEDFLTPPPRVKVSLPGLTETLDQTYGGAQTTYKSYNEGMQGASLFGDTLASVGDAKGVVSAMNSPYTEHPGQFRINATDSKGVGVSNVQGGNYSRGFTVADLSDPNVLKTLKVYAGVLGAPAEQPALRDYLMRAILAANAGTLKPTAAPPTPGAPNYNLNDVMNIGGA